MLGPMLALERFPPKVGIFDTRQRSVQRWKQVATSIWYTATRCDMCSPVVSSLEFGVVTVTCEISIFVACFFSIYKTLLFLSNW